MNTDMKPFFTAKITKDTKKRPFSISVLSALYAFSAVKSSGAFSSLPFAPFGGQQLCLRYHPCLSVLIRG
jgi:hypothetical protein